MKAKESKELNTGTEDKRNRNENRTREQASRIVVKKRVENERRE